MSKANRSGHSVTIQSRPDLFAQWDTEANEDSLVVSLNTPSKKYAWKCEQGHKWNATLSYRKSNNAGCPVCAGKQVLEGYNDLASKYPGIASQWHPTKNELTPTEVTANNRKTFWWKCSQGHEWQAALSNRTRKGDTHSCPICTGKTVLPGVNDLQTHAEYLDEWSSKNDLAPSQIGWNSTIKVWWTCSEGHEWRMSPRERNEKGNGCRQCVGKKQYAKHGTVLSEHPKLASEWHPTRNADLSVENVSSASGVKVWWMCDKGHEWQAYVHNRTLKGTGCPHCSGKNVRDGEADLASRYPEIASQWHPTKNLVEPEFELAKSLKSLGLAVTQSDRTLLSKNFELDIFVPEQNFAIEFNGVYWHSEKFKDKNYHQKKHQMCRDKGIYLYQVWEDDWMYRKEIVLRGIAHRLGLTQKLIEVYPELDPRILERLGARKTSVVEVTYAVAAGFLEENHIQGKATGTAYLGLQDENNGLRAVMVLKKSTDNAYLIERYATFGIVPGGFTKLLKYATQILPVDKFVTFSDHSLSDGKLYADNGFIADKVLPPDYSYLVNARRVHKFNYRLKRFREDPNLLFEEGLTETELAALNNLPRIWDSGKTRWVKSIR